MQCDCCEEWYHPACINLAEDDVDLDTNSPWVCQACTDVVMLNPLIKHSGRKITIFKLKRYYVHYDKCKL